MHLPPLGLYLFAPVSLGMEERGQIIIRFFTEGNTKQYHTSLTLI